MRRFIVGGLVAVVGAAFIILTLTQNLFRVGTDFEALTTDFRPVMQDESIQGYQAGIEGLAAAGEEFQTQLMPALSLALQMSPEQLQAFMADQYPATAQGMAALPQLTTEFGGLVTMLDQQQSNFESADAIPTSNVVAQTVPWGFFVFGLAALGLGIWAIAGHVKFTSTAALVLGVVVIVATFAMAMPSKASDADDLNAALKPVYTTETVQQAQGGLAVLGAMGNEMSTSMLPGLAEAMQLTPDQLNAFLENSFPATAQALATMPEALASFDEMATVFDQNLENYDTIKPVDMSNLVWALIGGSLLLALAGAFGLFGRGDALEPHVEHEHDSGQGEELRFDAGLEESPDVSTKDLVSV